MKIILASQSPRRKKLLSEIISEFEVHPSTLDESQIIEQDPIKLAEKTATLKTVEVQQLYPNALIIGGDTLGICGDTVLVKPKDYQGAVNMLKLLSDKSHDIISSVCISYQQKNIFLCKHEITTVIFNKLSDSQIETYLDQGTYKDKAGAYAIQDIGNIFIKEIRGSHDNVVGFPTQLFKSMYNKVLAQLI